MRVIGSLIALTVLLFAYASPSVAETETYDDWIRTARIGGLSLKPGATQAQIDTRLAAHREEGVSVIELDSDLSRYLSASEFAGQIAHIDLVARRAHRLGLKVVIYYPSLEVLTTNGATKSSTMGKDHPDWLQLGLDGTPNVFYGTRERWVPDNDESAWLSPNSPGYRDYFIDRVKRLAGTAVDGIWIDVPLYLETGVEWPDVHPNAISSFEAWSVARGYGYSGPPGSANIEDQKFRHWLQWRSENLAGFVDEVRASAIAVNPDWVFVTEVFPIDYLDTIWTGLEPALLKRADNSVVVWELDGVSDSSGMEYANTEDFSNLIAMTKLARAIDRGRPGWGFSYGNLPIDAGLVMAAVVAEQLSPFETKTPVMTNSVGSDFRRTWFEFIRDNEEKLLKSNRAADVGVWFSVATKTYHDFANGGIYGMYIETRPPANAKDWWADSTSSSLRRADHLAGWRGAAYALNNLHVPYKAVVDPGDPTAEMQDLSLMWLPSVVALSDESAQMLREYVGNGGTLLATGHVPGTMDEHGEDRGQSNLADVFGFAQSQEEESQSMLLGIAEFLGLEEFFGIEPVAVRQGPRMQSFGRGVAIYRPDIRGADLFETGGAIGAAALKERNHGQVEQIVRIHTPDRIIADELGEGVHITLSEPTETEQHVFILNYSGLQKPARARPKRIPFHYRAPKGLRVVGAEISAPGGVSPNEPLPYARSGESTWMVEPLVDQIAIATFQLAPSPATAAVGPPALIFATDQRETAVIEGLDFVVNKMRHTSAPQPYSFGIRTNHVDNNEDTTVYTGGHHVTNEHMGLFLRVTALLQHQDRYDEALEFLRGVLYSPGYHVLAWSMHKNKLKPFLQPDMLNGEDVWMAANAPLDDLRSVRGMFDGATAFDQPETEQLAHSVLNGIYWTSVTDRLRGIAAERPRYPGGVLGYSWDWENHDDDALEPPASGTGRGRLGADLIPVDYQDLGTLAIGARDNPRLRSVIASAVDLMLGAEIPGSPGLFYNGLNDLDQWTGDFEFPDKRQGKNLKVIQELWTALHLMRVSDAKHHVLDQERRKAAHAAASRSYTFFKSFYNNNGRIPEYLTLTGSDVPDGNTGKMLVRGSENLFNGEVRIYAQLARLALLVGDSAFAAELIEDKILSDREADPASPLYGFIGVSTASADDAEAFNVLEALLTLCLEARTDIGPPLNTAPTAMPDVLAASKDNVLLIAPVDLLGNDSDAEDDVLSLDAVDAASMKGGSVTPKGTRWLYTPPRGFVGEDSFSYAVTDGTGIANSGVTVRIEDRDETVREINADGDLSDWPAGHFVVTDPDDISGVANRLDIREIHLSKQDDKLHIGYVNEGPAVPSWAYIFYIDTDKDQDTGFPVGGIGADYILEENELKIYAGDGDSWQWATVGVASVAVAGDTIELWIPVRFFAGATRLRMYFLGDNLAYEPDGSGEDIVPDPDPDDRWIDYDLVLNSGMLGGQAEQANP